MQKWIQTDRIGWPFIVKTHSNVIGQRRQHNWQKNSKFEGSSLVLEVLLPIDSCRTSSTGLEPSNLGLLCKLCCRCCPIMFECVFTINDQSILSVCVHFCIIISFLSKKGFWIEDLGFFQVRLGEFKLEIMQKTLELFEWKS